MSTKRYTRHFRVLSEANHKTVKGLIERNVDAVILHLAPANESGREMCAGRDANCTKACLFRSGNAAIFPAVNRARIAKTKRFWDDRAGFMADLVADIERLVNHPHPELDNPTPAVRLNGTSDWPWEYEPCVRGGVAYRNIMTAFPDVQFYDYTKLPGRIGRKLPSNYHVTFSLSSTNDRIAHKALLAGMNVAVVFHIGKNDPLPQVWSGRPVVNGDEHDLRFLDAKGGNIIALTPKGSFKKADNAGGFFRDPASSLELGRMPVFTMAAD